MVLALLAVVHGTIALGGFIAPYDPTTQNRDFSYAAPMQLHLGGQADGLSWRPFVYGLKEVPGDYGKYEEDKSQQYPLQFFVVGTQYRVLGIFPSNRHLFGAQENSRVFLLGTDGLGRD